MNESTSLQVQPNMKNSIFFLLWIGINVGSWAVWIVLATSPASPFVQFPDVLSHVGLFLIGGGMAVLQWLLLKQQFSIAWYEWIIVTTIGFTLGFYGLIWAALRDFYIVFSSPGTPVLEWDPLLGGALLGLALGCCQSIVWRPRFDRIIIWIVINVLGWSLGMFLPQLAAFLLDDSSTSWLSTLFPVAFAAMATGIVLIWFLGEQYDMDKQT